MSDTYEHPFDCEECKTRAPEEFEHYEPTDVWFICYPKKRTMHLHFGFSTSSAEESTEETTWINKWAVEKWFPKYKDINFAVIVDMTRGDDSEFPSKASMKMYKEMLKHPQNSITVFYGATHSMKMILNLLLHAINQHNHIHIVETKTEADQLYHDWFKKQ